MSYSLYTREEFEAVNKSQVSATHGDSGVVVVQGHGHNVLLVRGSLQQVVCGYGNTPLLGCAACSLNAACLYQQQASVQVVQMHNSMRPVAGDF